MCHKASFIATISPIALQLMFIIWQLMYGALVFIVFYQCLFDIKLLYYCLPESVYKTILSFFRGSPPAIRRHQRTEQKQHVKINTTGHA